jgi:hypothetical protein
MRLLRETDYAVKVIAIGTVPMAGREPGRMLRPVLRQR